MIGATCEEYLVSCLYTNNTPPLHYLRYGCYGVIGILLTRWLDGYLTRYLGWIYCACCYMIYKGQKSLNQMKEGSDR